MLVKTRKHLPYSQVSIIYYWISAICSLRPYHHNSQVCHSSLLSSCLIHSKLRSSFLTRGDKGKAPDNNWPPKWHTAGHYSPYVYWTPFGSDGKKESACKAEDSGLIPGWQDSPGEKNGYPLQYSYLENPMDRGAWRVKVHEVAKSWT